MVSYVTHSLQRVDGLEGHSHALFEVVRTQNGGLAASWVLDALVFLDRDVIAGVVQDVVSILFELLHIVHPGFCLHFQYWVNGTVRAWL